MKLFSWNVNGIRAVLGKGSIFSDFIEQCQPDVLCLQETRAQPEQVDLSLDGYDAFWYPAEKAGYSGTAVFTRIRPADVRRGLGIAELDKEGRVLNVEFDDFNLVNVYTPNSGSELTRLEYRHDVWDVEFLKYVRKLDRKKPVIFCGDLNVAHKEIDLARPTANHKSAGFTDEEREGFDNIVAAGFIDSFRHFNAEGDNYTWWSYRGGARSRNVGWRIDYFCISPKLISRLESAWINADVMGSDHCPVGIELAS